MSDPLVLHVPVELGLELVPPVCADRMDAEGELLQRVVDEGNGIVLIVSG